MLGSTAEAARTTRRSPRSRIADAILWSWEALDPELRDGLTDPSTILSQVPCDCTTIYWELHFEERRRTRTDFLCLVPLATPASMDAASDTRAGESGCAPLLRGLDAWWSSPEVQRLCHAATWLELDGPLTAAFPASRVGVSVGLDRDGGGAGFWRLPSAGALGRVFHRFQTACGARASGATVLREVETALRGVGGAVRHLSVMRGRDGAPAKVYVVTPKDVVGDFLMRIGWPGDVNAAVATAEAVYPEQARAYFDLQFTDRLAGLVGFEFFSEPPPPADPLRRGPTERAIAQGLLEPAQVAALQRWVGRFRQNLGNDYWPTSIFRWFDLKFTCPATGDRALKAYLGVQLGTGVF